LINPASVAVLCTA
jgi:hypothetical protein